MSVVQITPLPEDPTAAHIEAVHRVLADAAAAVRPDDPPLLLEEVAGRLRTRRESRRLLRWVARTDAGIVGYGLLRLSDVDNQHLGQADVVVHPEHRRQGTGTALLREITAALVADGRRVLIGEADEGSPGEPFCRSFDLPMVQADRMSLLRLADVDWADVEAAAAAPHPGYRLERWLDRCPDDLLERFAAAKTAMNDAPFDDVDFTGFVYTPAVLREDEAAVALQFGQFRGLVAVHEESGEVAGLTEVYVSKQPYRSHQGDTAVVGAHRGSGLGLWLKAAMLVWLRAERPDIGELLTGNAASNAHMLRINDRLGYQPYVTMLGFQGDAAAMLATLDRAVPVAP